MPVRFELLGPQGMQRSRPSPISRPASDGPGGFATPRSGAQQTWGSFDGRSGRETPRAGQDNPNSLDDMEKVCIVRRALC